MIIEIDRNDIIAKAEIEIEENILEMSYPSNINYNNWDNLAKQSYDKVKKNIDSKANIYIIMVKVDSNNSEEYEVKYNFLK